MKKITFLLFGLTALVACEAELETQKANSLGNENVLSRNGSTISPDAAAAMALEFRNSILEQSGHSTEVLCAAADGDARLQAWGRCSIDDELLTAAALVSAGTSAARPPWLPPDDELAGVLKASARSLPL